MRTRIPLRIGAVLWIGLSAHALTFGLFAQTQPSTNLKDEAVVLPAFQVQSSGDKGYLSKNTLSGTRTSARVIDIPQEIAIVSPQLLADLGVDGMLPAVQMVAGGVTRRGFNVGDDLFIRGFRAANTLKDGFSFGSNAVGTLYDVDRVEVVKGPAALIFGSSSFTGGIINYVSRRPTHTRQAEIKGAVGSFNYYRGEAHLSGPVTRSKDIRYRLDVGTTDSDMSDRRFGFYNDKFVGAGLEYEINPNTRLSIDAAAVEVDYVYPQTVFDPLTRRVLAQSKDFSLEEAFSNYETRQQRVTATLTSTIGEKLDLRLFVGYNNGGNDWIRPYALGFQADNSTLNRIAESYYTSSHFTNLQIDILKQFVTGPIKHKASIGAELTSGRSAALNDSFALAPLNVRNPQWGAKPSTVPGSGAGGYIDRSYGNNRSSGIYAQDHMSMFQDRLVLIAGARHHNVISNSGATGAATSTTRLNSKTVKRLGALYHPVKNVSVYYNNSESFLFNGGLDYLGRQLVPSVGKISEFGAKVELFNGALVASGSYFDIELTNVRVVFTQGPGDPNPGIFGARQTGLEKNKGYDISLATSRSFSAGELNLVASIYSGDIRNATNLKPVHAVNNTSSLFGVFTFTKGAASSLGLGGGVYVQGEKIGPNLAGRPVKFDGYTTANAFASYTYKKLRLQINIDNLADKDFIEGGESALWIHTSKGRTFKFTTSCRF